MTDRASPAGERPAGAFFAEPTRFEYLLAELRCALLRARLAAADIEAVAVALRGGLITAEQALELLADCDCLRLVQPEPEHG